MCSWIWVLWLLIFVCLGVLVALWTAVRAPKSDRIGLGSQLWHLCCDLTSQCLTFFICKMGITILLASEVVGRCLGGSSEVTCVWCPAQCLVHGKHPTNVSCANTMIKLLRCVCACVHLDLTHYFVSVCVSIPAHVCTHMCMQKCLSLYMPVPACLCVSV